MEEEKCIPSDVEIFRSKLKGLAIEHTTDGVINVVGHG